MDGYSSSPFMLAYSPEAAGEAEIDRKTLFALIFIFHLIQNFLQVSVSTLSAESIGQPELIYPVSAAIQDAYLKLSGDSAHSPGTGPPHLATGSASPEEATLSHQHCVLPNNTMVCDPNGRICVFIPCVTLCCLI